MPSALRKCIDEIGFSSTIPGGQGDRRNAFDTVDIFLYRQEKTAGRIDDLSAVSLSCPNNNQKSAQPCRCRVSGATGANDYTPTPHEWNKNWQSNCKKMEYTTRPRSRYP